MPIILDQELYDRAKREIYSQYTKPSAFRSGALVKRYKELGGRYGGPKPRSGLTQWFKEEWKDIGNASYPVFRPTRRVSKTTPLLPSEIDPKNLKQQIQLKQKIKGSSNLPPFKKKK